MGIPTSTNPLFAGYLGDHSRWHEGRWAPCPGTHHAHGGPTAERSGQPGWSPLAHLRAGDVIRVHEYSLPYCQDHQILYIRPSTGNRLHVSWLIERGTGGWFVAPGTPVLLVRPVDGPPPEPHYRVAFRNAISSHGRESHCYATVDEARVSARDHRPWNNTASAIHECWRPECRPVS